MARQQSISEELGDELHRKSEEWVKKLNNPPYRELFIRIPDRLLRENDLVSVVMVLREETDKIKYRSPKLMIREKLSGTLARKLNTLIFSLKNEFNNISSTVFAFVFQAAVQCDEMMRLNTNRDSLLFHEYYPDIYVNKLEIDLFIDHVTNPFWTIEYVLKLYDSIGFAFKSYLDRSENENSGEATFIDWHIIPPAPIPISKLGDAVNDVHTTISTKLIYKEQVESFAELVEKNTGQFDISLSSRTRHTVADIENSFMKSAGLTATNDENSIIKSGDKWNLTFQGKSVSLNDVNGIRYIAQLIDNPDHAILAYDLYINFSKRQDGRDPEDRIEVLAESNRIDYHSINDLKNEYRMLLEDKDYSDEKETKEEREMEFPLEKEERLDCLEQYLSRELNIQGKPRDKSVFEKGRQTVTQAIERVEKKLKGKDFLPAFGEFIEHHITTGKACKYKPPVGHNKIEWVIKK